jgi:hypothetical protein
MCYGVGTLRPGPSKMNKTEFKAARPYFRLDSIFSEVTQLFTLYSEILGEISTAVSELLPSVYKENREVAIEDCTYPTPKMQRKGKDHDDNKIYHWYCNQVIARVIGRDFGNMKASDMRIAMHYDGSDQPGPQLLVFSPCDNHVQDSDLLIFENKQGGRCYRVDTTIKDTMTIVLMNSAEQLHASAIEPEGQQMSHESYSIRMIHYIRADTKLFDEERKKRNINKGPFLEMKIPYTHTKPIDADSITDGQLVSFRFWKGKFKDRYKCIATRKANGRINLAYLNGGSTEWYPGLGDLFHPKCTAGLQMVCTRCWTLPDTS